MLPIIACAWPTTITDTTIDTTTDTIVDMAIQLSLGKFLVIVFTVPVLLFQFYCSSFIVMPPVRTLLSLGSNLGDRAQILAEARRQLQMLPKTKLLRASRELDNPALLYKEQPAFLNQVVELMTALQPEELLDHLQVIEQSLGRIKRFRYGPREIDLDILTYGELSLASQRLTLPHPALGRRPFLTLLLKELENERL